MKLFIILIFLAVMVQGFGDYNSLSGRYDADCNCFLPYDGEPPHRPNIIYVGGYVIDEVLHSGKWWGSLEEDED